MTDHIKELGRIRQERMRERRRLYRDALVQIRDDRANIRTIEDAITAAAIALAPPRTIASAALARTPKETR